MRGIRIIVAVLVAACMSFMSPVSATAAPTDDYSQVVAALTQYGVPAATQNQLVHKLQQGVLWDSLKGGKPASVRQSTQSGYTTTVSTYPDGSIVVSTVSAPSVPTQGASSSQTVTPQSVSGCSYSGGSYWYSYTGCLASITVILASMTYHFDYQGSYSTSTITNYYGLATSYNIPGGTVSGKQLYSVSSTMVRGAADYSSPATGTTTTCLTTWVTGVTTHSDGSC